MWLYVLWTNHNKTKAFGASLLVIASYFIYACLSAILFFLDSDYGNLQLSIFPFVYLFVMLRMSLSTGISYDNSKVVSIQKPSRSLVIAFLIIFSICSLVSFPAKVNSLLENYTLLFVSEEGGADLYKLQHESTKAFDYGVSGIYGLCSVFNTVFSDVALLVYFYYLTLKKNSKVLNIILGITFILELLMPMTSGGRTGVVMGLSLFGVSYLIFKDFWSSRLRKVFRIIGFTLLSIVGFAFAALTISRFGNTDAGSMNSVLSYAGQAPLNFNINGLDAGGIRNGDRTCNSFKQLLGLNPPPGVVAVRQQYHNMTMDDSIFYTFVGDFTLDFGPIVAFLLFVFFSIIFVRMTKSNGGVIDFYKLIMVYFSLVICMQGGMYLFNYSFLGNLRIIGFVICIILFAYDGSKQTVKQYISKDNYESNK